MIKLEMAQKRLKIKLASINRKHSDLRKLRQKHWKKTNEDWYDHHRIRRDINCNKYILFTTISALEKTKFQTAQLSVQLEDQISNVHNKLNLEHGKSQDFSIGRKLQKYKKKFKNSRSESENYWEMTIAFELFESSEKKISKLRDSNDQKEKEN